MNFGKELEKEIKQLEKDLKHFNKTGVKTDYLSRMEASTPNYKLVRRGQRCQSQQLKLLKKIDNNFYAVGNLIDSDKIRLKGYCAATEMGAIQLAEKRDWFKIECETLEISFDGENFYPIEEAKRRVNSSHYFTDIKNDQHNKTKRTTRKIQ